MYDGHVPKRIFQPEPWFEKTSSCALIRPGSTCRYAHPSVRIQHRLTIYSKREGISAIAKITMSS